MRLFEYKCLSCGRRLERWEDSPPHQVLLKCPWGCGGRFVRVYTPPAIRLRGAGFHKTDYGNGNEPKQ